MTPKGIGNTAGKALLVLCSLLLSLCVLELAVRGLARLTSQERVITPDNILGWRLIPYAKTFHQRDVWAYHVAINSKGLRDRERSYDKPAGIFRIVVMGDSMVFGSGGVEVPDRFTDILERSTENVEVINMGVPGYGADQEYLYLKTEAFKYHPDLVVFCAFFNDFDESFSAINPGSGRPKGYFSLSAGQLVFHSPSFSMFYKLSQDTYLLGLADVALRKISGAYRRLYRRPGLVLDPEARLATFTRLYTSAAELCRQHGSEFVILYLPYPGQVSTINIQQVMDDLAATDNIRTLDLMDTMQRAQAVSPAYFRNDIHLNKYGHQVVANALHGYLIANDLVVPHVAAIHK